MPKTCSAYNCRRRCVGENKSLAFHKFPHNNPELLRKWVLATRWRDWYPSRSAVLCELHFRPSDYVSSDIDNTSHLAMKRKRLVKDAVPSVFDFPEHLLKATVHRKPPIKRVFPTLRRAKLKKIQVVDASSDHSYAARTSSAITGSGDDVKSNADKGPVVEAPNEPIV